MWPLAGTGHLCQCADMCHIVLEITTWEILRLLDVPSWRSGFVCISVIVIDCIVFVVECVVRRDRAHWRTEALGVAILCTVVRIAVAELRDSKHGVVWETAQLLALVHIVWLNVVVVCYDDKRCG